MITLSFVYLLGGALFTAVAILSGLDPSNPKRARTTAFWGLMALSLLLGDQISDFGNGLIVVSMAVIAGTGGLGKGTLTLEAETERQAFRQDRGAHIGNWLLAPALIVPTAALTGTLLLKDLMVGGVHLVDPKQATLISMAFGVLLALAIALPLIRTTPLVPLQEARRLLDTVGWSAILPQALAALGAVFALAGVGKVIGDLTATYIPAHSPLAAVALYCCGMAGFTILMGNAFAAFPSMKAGIGLPLVIMQFGGDPAVVCAIGMLSGFCGTLMTPMAANFNLVPAALLELPDRYSVIKVQAPTALILLAANIALMTLFAFKV